MKYRLDKTENTKQENTENLYDYNKTTMTFDS